MNGVTVNEFPWKAFLEGGYQNYVLKGYPHGKKLIDNISPSQLRELVNAWDNGSFSIEKKCEGQDVAQE